jgi:exosortase C (VPDSG-CTERM-specific)
MTPGHKSACGQQFADVVKVLGDTLTGGVAADQGAVFLRKNFTRFVGYLGVLALVYAAPLVEWIRLCLKSGLHSHEMLMPLVAGYLIWLDRKALSSVPKPSNGWTLAFSGIALALVLLSFSLPFTPGDRLALRIASFLAAGVAGAMHFFGSDFLRRIVYPVSMLVFMIPIPKVVVDGSEVLLQHMSAEAADIILGFTGMPFFRSGLDFHIANSVPLSVAPECSGMRATLVLFITSLLAAYMFLRSRWRRTILVALVLPLGVARNGFRIATLAVLCSRNGPEVLDSWIHHKGGQLFFALSLVPLFAVLWWMMRQEAKTPATGVKIGKEMST